MKNILIALGLAIIFGVNYWYQANQYQVMNRIEAEGVQTQGTITDKYTEAVRRGENYFVKFHYVANTSIRKASREVARNFYEDSEIGSTIPVKYLSGDPNAVMIDGQPLTSGFAYYLSIILLTAAVVFTGYCVFVCFRESARPRQTSPSQ